MYTGVPFNFSVPEGKEMKKSSLPPPVPPRTNHSHHVTTTYITQDEVTVSSASSTTLSTSGAATTTEAGVQISVNSTNAASAGDRDPKKKKEILKLREMLLTDTSVESS